MNSSRGQVEKTSPCKRSGDVDAVLFLTCYSHQQHFVQIFWCTFDVVDDLCVTTSDSHPTTPCCFACAKTSTSFCLASSFFFFCMWWDNFDNIDDNDDGGDDDDDDDNDDYKDACILSLTSSYNFRVKSWLICRYCCWCWWRFGGVLEQSYNICQNLYCNSTQLN